MRKKDKEFVEILKELKKDPMVMEMKKYRQHYDVSTYVHCMKVAYINYRICKFLKLDYVSATRAGMLHDLFLYDWRDERPHTRFSDLHAFSHPKISLENAKKICKLNEKEEDIIIKHMWPVTFFSFPKYKETYVITLSDKISAILEMIEYYKKKSRLNKVKKLMIKQKHKENKELEKLEKLERNKRERYIGKLAI